MCAVHSKNIKLHHFNHIDNIDWIILINHYLGDIYLRLIVYLFQKSIAIILCDWEILNSVVKLDPLVLYGNVIVSKSLLEYCILFGIFTIKTMHVTSERRFLADDGEELDLRRKIKVRHRVDRKCLRRSKGGVNSKSSNKSFLAIISTFPNRSPRLKSLRRSFNEWLFFFSSNNNRFENCRP